MRVDRSRLRFAAVLALCGLILALGFCLRARHVSWGVPGVRSFEGSPVGFLHPDEWALVHQTQRVLETGGLFGLEHFKYGPMQALLGALLVVVSPLSPQRQADLYLACRWVSVVAGTLSLPVILYIGTRWNQRVGVLAALYLAVTMTAARDSRWCNPDPLCALFLLLTIAFSLAALARPTNRRFLLGGVFLGMAVSTKLFSVFFLHLPFLVSYALCRRRDDTANGTPEEDAFFPLAGIARVLRFVSILAAGTFLALAVLYLPILGWVRPLVETIYRLDLGAPGHAHPVDFWIELFQRHLPSVLNTALLLCAAVSLLAGLLVVRAEGFLRRGRIDRTRFLRYRKAWLFLAGFLAVSAMFLGVSALSNPLPFLSFILHHLQWAGPTGKFGLFPACLPIPSFTGAFLPVAMGWPLFLTAASGIVWILVRRDGRGLLVLAGVLPFWVLLEISRYHTLRFSISLLPYLCLFAALLTDALLSSRRGAVRGVGAALLGTSTLFSLFYTAAFVEAIDPAREPRVKTAIWVRRHVEPGIPIGGTGYNVHPWNMHPLDTMAGYPLVDYTQEPEYAVLPQFIHGVMDRYLSLVARGCVYGPDDWWPLSPPGQDAVRVYRMLLEEDGYRLVRTFENPTGFAGVSFDPCVLPFEHVCNVTNPVMRVYRKTETAPRK